MPIPSRVELRPPTKSSKRPGKRPKSNPRAKRRKNRRRKHCRRLVRNRFRLGYAANVEAGEDARCPERGRPRPQPPSQGEGDGKFQPPSSANAAADQDGRAAGRGAPAESHNAASGWPALLLQSHLGLAFGFLPLEIGLVARRRPGLWVRITPRSPRFLDSSSLADKLRACR